MKLSATIAGTLLAFILAGCVHRVPPAKPIGAKITGTVTYPQSTALAPEATIEVTFSDVSRPDTGPIQLGHQTTRAAGKKPPFPFEIVYDARQIVSSHNYAVEATIKLGGRILFAGDPEIPVLTQGRPSTVEIVVKPK